jgi:hypothetical protein
MTATNKALTRQMLEWISSTPRTREEVLQVWRTSCPRLSIWEDACIDGLVAFGAGGAVMVTESGARLLAAGRSHVPREHDGNQSLRDG